MKTEIFSLKRRIKKESFMRTTFSRKLAVLAGLLGAATAAWADDYPNKPIKIVVGYVPGGGPDALARMLAPKLTNILGQSVIVENKPGASGSVATAQVSKLPPDGYTLLLGETGQLVITPNLIKGTAYDATKDLTPIAMLVTTPVVLVSNAKTTNIKSLQDMVREAKANPGKLNYGSSGNGSIHHIAMEAFKTQAGLDLVHVPYKGGGQSVPALLGGEIPLLMTALQVAWPHIKAGRMHMLAVTTNQRYPDTPEVPSMAEVVKNYSYPSDFGVLAPPGLPKPIVDKLTGAIKTAMASPDIQERLKATGFYNNWKTSEQYREVIREELKKYEQAIKAANINID
jgi:tripartite-type tricarboxylate transporter receptor subunit TctC